MTGKNVHVNHTVQNHELSVVFPYRIVRRGMINRFLIKRIPELEQTPKDGTNETEQHTEE